MAYLKANGIKKAGLLATSGTILSGIYHKAAQDYGISLVTPSGAALDAVMGVIYDGVKAGVTNYDTTAFKSAVQSLFDEGAETMILGCTELSLVPDLYHLNFPATDPTLILAQAAIRACGYECK